MKRKTMLVGCIVLALTLVAALPVFAGGGTQALKGQEIIIGNFWEDYDVNTWKPRNEVEEMELEWRKKIQQDNNFKISTKQVAGWGEMLETVATSIMAGKPVAHALWMTPQWAMALYKQGLILPVDTKAVNLKNSNPVVGKSVAYNQDVAALFTFGGKQYAIGIGYGDSQHGAGVYFNKRLLREAGLNTDAPYDMKKAGTWTWDNFLTMCKQLTRDRNNDGIMDTYAMTADLSTEILDQIVFSNGGSYVAKDSRGRFINNTNKPEFIEALQFARRLMAEGVMMPRPENSNWDWYWPAFHDGHVAFMMEPEWRRGQMSDMTDDWGFVLFPKGPRVRDYRFPNDENILVIPVTYKDQLDAILTAVNLWYTPVTTDWKAGLYPNFRDRRAVDETMAMIRGPKNGAFRNYIMIPGLERGDIAWQMWWFDGEPSQLVESVSQSWNALIDEANQ